MDPNPSIHEVLLEKYKESQEKLKRTNAKLKEFQRENLRLKEQLQDTHTALEEAQKNNSPLQKPQETLKKQIISLNTTINSLQEKTEALNEQREAELKKSTSLNKTIKNQQGELKRIRDELIATRAKKDVNKEIEVSRLKKDLAQITQKLAESEKHKRQSDATLAFATTELTATQEMLSLSQIEIQRLNEELENRQRVIAEQTAVIEKLKKELQASENALNKHKFSLASELSATETTNNTELTQQLNNLTTDLEKSQIEIKRLTEELAKKEKEASYDQMELNDLADKLKQLSADHEKQIAHLNKENEKLAKTNVELTKKLEEERRAREKAEKEKDAAKKEREAAKKEIDKLEKAVLKLLGDLKHERAILKKEREQLKKHINDSNKEKQIKKEEQDKRERAAQNKIAKLQEQINFLTGKLDDFANGFDGYEKRIVRLQKELELEKRRNAALRKIAASFKKASAVDAEKPIKEPEGDELPPPPPPPQKKPLPPLPIKSKSADQNKPTITISAIKPPTPIIETPKVTIGLNTTSATSTASATAKSVPKTDTIKSISTESKLEDSLLYYLQKCAESFKEESSPKSKFGNFTQHMWKALIDKSEKTYTTISSSLSHADLKHNADELLQIRGAVFNRWGIEPTTVQGDAKSPTAFDIKRGKESVATFSREPEVGDIIRKLNFIAKESNPGPDSVLHMVLNACLAAKEVGTQYVSISGCQDSPKTAVLMCDLIERVGFKPKYNFNDNTEGQVIELLNSGYKLSEDKELSKPWTEYKAQLQQGFSPKKSI